MFKNFLTLLVLSVFFSCGNFTPKHKFSIIYEFENFDKISAEDKQNTIEVLNRRLDKFASNYEVKFNNKQQIEIKLSTNFELESVNAIVANPGKLEFWECFKTEDVAAFFGSVFESMKAKEDSTEKLLDSSSRPYAGGILSFESKDVEKLNELFQSKEVLQLLPQELKRSKFLFGQPIEGRVDLYIIKLTPNGKAFVNETHITDARQSFTITNRPAVTMQMNEIGAQRWERMTEQSYQQYTQIAITLNDVVYSAPTASSGAILGGNTEISGNFTVNEAQHLALILSSQKRIPKLKFVNTFAINDEL